MVRVTVRVEANLFEIKRRIRYSAHMLLHREVYTQRRCPTLHLDLLARIDSSFSAACNYTTLPQPSHDIIPPPS